MQFRITSELLVHATKFYQIFRIERFNSDGRFEGRAATVGHYGPHTALSRSHRPIGGGQCAVYPGTKHNEKMEEKKRKGYVSETGPDQFDYETEDDFRRWLVITFPTRAREQILVTLGLALDPNAQPIDPDDEPIAVAETQDNEPDERPEGWGDW